MATVQAVDGVAELVVRAQQGDAAAFAALYERYRPLVQGYLRRRLSDSEDVVEDLTEDVFVKVYEKLGSYADRGYPFAAWLYRIAHNLLIDHVRARSRQAVRPLEVADDMPDQGATVDYRRILDRELLEPALARLTPEQRQAVELRFLDGKSTAETALLMDRSEDAVKKLQARALQSLRRFLSTPADGPRRAACAAA